MSRMLLTKCGRISRPYLLVQHSNMVLPRQTYKILSELSSLDWWHYPSIPFPACSLSWLKFNSVVSGIARTIGCGLTRSLVLLWWAKANRLWFNSSRCPEVIGSLGGSQRQEMLVAHLHGVVRHESETIGTSLFWRRRSPRVANFSSATAPKSRHSSSGVFASP